MQSCMETSGPQADASVLTQALNCVAGCLPTLATIPIFWGLYRTLSNVSQAGLLTEGFYWIPSLSGPASLADQRAGNTAKTCVMSCHVPASKALCLHTECKCIQCMQKGTLYRAPTLAAPL